MNYTVKMSEEAEDNLKAVIEYISIELKMPHAASNLYYKIKNLIQSLATMPERFKEYDKEKYKSYNLRMVSVDNYCIFYPLVIAVWILSNFIECRKCLFMGVSRIL